MASKPKTTRERAEPPKREAPDTPLLDLSDAAIKKLIRTAKERGYVTVDQINSALPSGEVNSEQIEDVLAMFSEVGGERRRDRGSEQGGGRARGDGGRARKRERRTGRG